jgi:hypothetical protein
VVQEVYGLVLAHYVVRRVMHDAAVVAVPGPDRLSFTDSPRVLQCQLPEAPHMAAEAWYQRLLREVRRQELRTRRDRWHPRVIELKMSNWGKKRPEHRNPPQPTKPFREAVVLLIYNIPRSNPPGSRRGGRHRRTGRVPGASARQG